MMSRRSVTGGGLAVALLLGSLLAPAAAADDPTASVDANLLERLDERDEARFWVELRADADLAAAAAAGDWTARGEYVVEQLTSTADQSQHSIQSLLAARDVDFTSFWIVNAILVTGGKSLVDELAARPEVAQIRLEHTFELPEAPTPDDAGIAAVEWGVDRIGADDVWTTFGVRGEDIVVGSIDTGVQYDHPALVDQYRGNRGDGTFDHNYNWWDPSEVCGSPSLEPCDNHGHGTHTTGTVVGDDGASNQIGVAPGARWIAAKGCETNRCSESALVSAGQWMLAPTDLTGANPDPSKRPHIINNSWGGDDGADTFYQPIVQAWVDAGIFPAFANGNAGPACGTVGAPASYPESFGVGGFDSNNNVYINSSRGPAPDAVGGETRPHISAPAVSVRSSLPGGRYGNGTGTSMATPHVSGAVALIWSAAPALVGDLDQTRDILGETAIDMSDLTCGGSPENNNVWGEGRLDAFAAVDLAPKGPSGELTGTVTDSASTDPLPGAAVTITGDMERVRQTGADGTYSVTLPVGDYTATASLFGYLDETVPVTIDEGVTTTQDFDLDPAPTWPVSGFVSEPDGTGVEGITVSIEDTPIPPATTDADGFYQFEAVPEGTYQIVAHGGRCLDDASEELSITSDTTLDFGLPRLTDDYGYFCAEEAPNYLEGDTPLGLSGLDDWTEQPLPFPFPYYGSSYDTAYVSTKGYVNFLAGNSVFSNTALPNPARPDAAIYPFWDDLDVDSAASTWTGLFGEAPHRQYVIEWRDVTFYDDGASRVDFGVVLHEDGQIVLQYRDIAESGRERGNSATVGIEDPNGAAAHEYSFNDASIAAGEFALRYQVAGHAFVHGTVTDAASGEPIGDATVAALAAGQPVGETTTDLDGSYLMRLPAGGYQVKATASGYESALREVTLDADGERVAADLELSKPREDLAWHGGFVGPGVDSVVYATVEWDGAVYVGGAFETVAGDVVNHIAGWDGTEWSSLGGGVNGIVESLAVYDGELIVGGSFTEAGGEPANGIARWNGSEWSALGDGVGGLSSPAAVLSMTVFDGDLIAGGNFLEADGIAVNRIARWDGSGWAPMAGGMNNRVLTLTVFDRQLIAGGAFSLAGGTPVNRIARWDGSQWLPLAGSLGQGVDALVMASAVFDDALVVGGVFTQAGGIDASLVARWDGQDWSPLGPGLTRDGSTPSVRALTVFGGELVAGGSFDAAGGEPVNQIARWNGQAWSSLGQGLEGFMPHIVPHAYALTVLDGNLVAGGNFTDAGGATVNGIARWTGADWSALSGASDGSGLSRFALALAEFEGDLIVGGDFTHAGNSRTSQIARWDGDRWSGLASELTGPSSGVSVQAIAEFEGDLIVAGHFSHLDGAAMNHIARWDGTAWSPLGAGVGGPPGASVQAVAVLNGELIAAGHFTQAGGVAVNHIARWDGQEWSPLGTGVRHQFTASVVDALVVHDGALYAGGTFLSAGGVSVNNIARWDGSEWSALAGPSGTGVNASVGALAVFDDTVVAGGSFSTAGGVSAGRVARWDGTEWSPLGAGVNSTVRDLTVFDGDLIAGGAFREAGGQTVDFVARWNGADWYGLAGPSGTGVNGTVISLATLNAGDSQETLAVGGAFSVTGGVGNWGLALYGPVEPPELSVAGAKIRGSWYADLTWTGLTSAEVDVYRDGALIDTTANQGSYTDLLGKQHKGATVVYQVCQAGTEVCTDQATLEIGAR